GDELVPVLVRGYRHCDALIGCVHDFPMLEWDHTAVRAGDRVLEFYRASDRTLSAAEICPPVCDESAWLQRRIASGIERYRWEAPLHIDRNGEVLIAGGPGDSSGVAALHHHGIRAGYERHDPVEAVR